MRLYIKASLNSELYDISVSSINGGSKEELANKLKKLLEQIPIGRYILDIGKRGYNSGYLKTDKYDFKWLYNNQKQTTDMYWETDDHYIVLPMNFTPSEKISYDDDTVVVYEVSRSDNEIYHGLEEDDPMLRDNWTYCKELGLYYHVDYSNNEQSIYLKWKVTA